MGLSSNILWHQTTTDSLKQILKTRSFHFAYSKETLPGSDKVTAFPMISFCNLPFAEFADYGNKYGGYSIGMSREWGMNNHFTPVLYCDETSNLIDRLSLTGKNCLHHQSINEALCILECLAYIKPIEGTLVAKGRKYSNYRFMDEREMRLVPNFNNLLRNHISPVLDENEYSEYKLKHNDNPMLSESISFEWADIKYIIVKNTTNITEYRKLLKRYGCHNDNIHIFSQQQVREDFIGIGHNKLARPILQPDVNHKELMKFMIDLAQQPFKDNLNIRERLRKYKIEK